MPTIWGLLYTHHRVPDAVLAAMLRSVAGAGLPANRLVIVCNRPDRRLPDQARIIYNDNTATLQNRGWESAILEQMYAGLARLPGSDVVCFLEHDVLYPPGYFSAVADTIPQAGITYYYGPIRHVDLRPGGRQYYWSSRPNGIDNVASCTFGRVAHLLTCVVRRQVEIAQGKPFAGGCYEPGLDGPVQVIARDATGHDLVPVLDLRHGDNTTVYGYHNAAICCQTSFLPVWGHVAHWLRVCGDSGSNLPPGLRQVRVRSRSVAPANSRQITPARRLTHWLSALCVVLALAIGLMVVIRPR